MTLSLVAKPDIQITMAKGDSDDDAEKKGRADSHNLARKGKTRCDSCGDVYDTHECVVKRVDFRTIRKPRRALRTRTMAKLCKDCLEKDDAWNTPEKYL